MMKEFYKKALPSTGVYCVATIDPIAKLTKHKFVENIDELAEFIESKKNTPTNIFVALSSFGGYSRKADEAKFVTAEKLITQSMLSRSLLISMLATARATHLKKKLSKRLTNSY